MNQEVGKALQSGEVKERFATLGAEPMSMKPDEFDAYVKTEIELNAVSETFARPQWIGAEVTSHASYYNSALANNPFSVWSDRDHRSA